MTDLQFGTVAGLTQDEQRMLQELAEVYNYHRGKNAVKDKYYEGHVTLDDVNLGIALPQGLRNLEVGCNGVRRHGHVFGDDRLRPSGHPPHQSAGTACAGVGSIDRG